MESHMVLNYGKDKYTTKTPYLVRLQIIKKGVKIEN